MNPITLDCLNKKEVIPVKNLTTKNRPINPMIYEKTRDGEMWYDIYSRLVKERILFISGEDGINSEDAVAISATLLFLDHQSKTKDISIYINSPGGSTDGLFTIYDTMQAIKAPIKTICMGEACSAAALLLGAGTKGKRFAFENATIMVHEVQVSGMAGTGSEIKREAARVEKLNEKIIETISVHTGQPIEKVKNDLKFDYYLTAKEAIEYGLIDGIVTKTKILPKITPKKVQGRRKV